MDTRFTQDIQGLLREGKKSDREDRERAERFSSLVKHPGFVDFVTLLNNKIEAMGSELTMPSLGLDGLVNTEYQKGAMYGMILARDLVAVTVYIDSEARKTATAGEDDDNS